MFMVKQYRMRIMNAVIGCVTIFFNIGSMLFVVLQSPQNANLQQRSNRLNADGSKYQPSSQHISTKQSTAGAVPTHHSTQNKHKSGVSYTEVSDRTPGLYLVSLNKLNARLAQSWIHVLVDI